MRNLIIISIFYGVLNFISISQNLEWAKSFGGDLLEDGISVVDAAGNIYTTGYFKGTVDFDPDGGGHRLTAIGEGTDVYIQKLDAEGDLVWARSLRGVGVGTRVSSSIGRAIIVDAFGDIYIVGNFSKTVDFDPSSNDYFMSSQGFNDLFVMKLSAGGHFRWAKSTAGTEFIDGRALAIDESGSIYLTGTFRGTVDFDPDTMSVSSLVSSGISNVFVLKLDTQGNFVWAKSAEGNGYSVGSTIALDDLGNIYVAGGFNGRVDFDFGPDTSIHTSKGINDIFVQKLDARGNLVWVKHIGGVANDGASAMVVDGLGNIYVTGFFSDAVGFDPGKDTDKLTVVGENDIFIQKLSSSGHLIWVKSMGGLGADVGRHIALDGSGNVYITGTFKETVDFDPGIGVYYLTALQDNEIFMQKLDADGKFVWAISLEGVGDDGGACIYIDESDNVYTTGRFEATVDFDPSEGVYSLTASGKSDIFIQKLSQGESVAIDKPQVSALRLYPNPSSGLIYIELPQGTHTAQLQIADALGRLVHQSTLSQSKNQLDLSRLLGGIYHLEMRTGSAEKFRGKLVLDK